MNGRNNSYGSGGRGPGPGRPAAGNGRPVGGSGYSGRVTPGRELTPEEKRKLKTSEKKELKKARKEQKIKNKLARKKSEDRKWQDGFERVNVGFDYVFLLIVAILVGLGVVMIFSASFPTAIKKQYGGSYYIKEHLVKLAAGAVLLIIASFASTKLMKHLTWPYEIICIIGLILTIRLGKEENGAQRWLEIGPVKLQPAEFAKLGIILLLAWYADRYEKKIKESTSRWNRFLWGVLIPSVAIGLNAILFLCQKHLSGAIITAGIGLVIMIAAGMDLRWILFYYLPIGAMGFIFYVLKYKYALRRIMSVYFEGGDEMKELWQVNQGLNAIGSGGLFGVGLGKSRQKFSYVSEAHNDFVFTIWCEEMGYVGAIAVVVLFMLLLYRGFKIGLKAADTFSSMTAIGITTHVGIQFFLNMAVVLKKFPTTGISLPFMSYGGTSLISLLLEMGIMMSISRHSYRKKLERVI